MVLSEEAQAADAWLLQCQATNDEAGNPLTEERWSAYGLDLGILGSYKLNDISAEDARNLGFTNTSNGIYIQYPKDSDSRIRWSRSGFALQAAAGKYGQRPNTLSALYYPPTMRGNWKQNINLPIVITEGEFKAIVIDTLVNGDAIASIIPCAIGGVFSWQSSKRGIDLIPDMADIAWSGRLCYVAFDMDKNTNPMVILALQRLANKLADLGADIRVLEWPISAGKGIDDYLCEQLDPKDSWSRLIESAQLPGHVASVIEMNGRYTYCEIQQQIYDSQNTTYISVRSFSSDFFTRKVKIKLGVKAGIPILKDIPIGKYWMESPFRSACIEPLFIPGKPRIFDFSGKKYLNTWLGWGQGLRSRPMEPKKGSVKPFYDFINAAFGGEDPTCVPYLIKRLAWMFQYPENKHPTWIYLMGKPLQGKSTLIKIISSLIGDRYTANVDESIVKGQFAEWRAEKLLITFDDSSISEPRTVRQLLKRLTTEVNSQVNLKYVKAQTVENYFSFIFATNSVDALLDHDDRRALVLEADCKWDFAKGEWSEFDAWHSTRAGHQALLHHLMYEIKLDAAFYNVVPPKTHARELVIEVSESTWDDTISYLAVGTHAVQWEIPASGLLRRWMPTVLSVDMLRHIFLLRNNDLEKFKISSATLVGKLVRYGAKRCMHDGSTDSRKRMMIDDEQIALWTWSPEWMRRTRKDYHLEYKNIKKLMPELFSARQKH